jgi:hypothetical protein
MLNRAMLLLFHPRNAAMGLLEGIQGWFIAALIVANNLVFLAFILKPIVLRKYETIRLAPSFGRHWN